MNPIVQKISKSPISKDELTAKEHAAATRPQTSKSVAEPKQSIPPSHDEGIPADFFSTDIGPTDEAKESVWKPGRNDRKSCRCSVPQARQACELKSGPMSSQHYWWKNRQVDLEY